MDLGGRLNPGGSMAKKLVGTLCFAALILAGTPAFAQSFTLKVGDIQGSSTVPGAVGFIDVLSFSYGVAAAVASGPVKGGATSRPSCSSFNTMMRLGKETGDLFLAVMQGTRFDTATFKVFDRSGAPAFDLVFNDVVLTSLQQSGSEGGGDVGIQSLSLTASRTTLKLYGMPPSESDWSCGR
jgi:type VI protein secretion system component Hcp